MGYCFDNRGRLVCDGCGTSGGVRRRKCPHTVLTDSVRSANGQRHTLSYCPPPALCSDCLKRHGGLKALHASCADGAALMQAEEDKTETMFQSGFPILVSGMSAGDGKVRAEFVKKDRSHVSFLVDAKDYDHVLRNYKPVYPELFEDREAA